MQDTRQHQQVYLDNGYKYVVLTYDIALGFYDVTHFKSRKNAERFNSLVSKLRSKTSF